MKRSQLTGSTEPLIAGNPSSQKKWYYVAQVIENDHDTKTVELFETEEETMPNAAKLRIQGIRNIGIYEWSFGKPARLVKTLAGD